MTTLPLPNAGCGPNHGASLRLQFNPSAIGSKRKRRPAGTPDPHAEIVALSPKTLMESERYVCEICNQGFQRDQNLQMHKRRHKVPWKLLKREVPELRKRVYVCPEPTCLHHDPCHALGDLVGIKKHFHRKHNSNKQWKCQKCFKGYAVQSDYKAHLKTCGTRGHSCDCGRIFSRVESFIEHQDICTAAKANATLGFRHASFTTDHHLSRTCSRSTPISSTPIESSWSIPALTTEQQHHQRQELQLLPSKQADSVVSDFRIPGFPLSRSRSTISARPVSLSACSNPKFQVQHSAHNQTALSLLKFYSEHPGEGLIDSLYELRPRGKHISNVGQWLQQGHSSDTPDKQAGCTSGFFNVLVSHGSCSSHSAINNLLDSSKPYAECEILNAIPYKEGTQELFQEERPDVFTDQQPQTQEERCAKAQGHMTAQEKLVYAEHARKLAKREIEVAEEELATAKRLRKQAQAELVEAQIIKEQAAIRIDTIFQDLICHACRQKLHLNQPHTMPISSSSRLTTFDDDIMEQSLNTKCSEESRIVRPPLIAG